MNESSRRDLRGRRILVVEDEGLIALHIQDILEEWGCTVLGPVASAAEALFLIGDTTLDAGILDVNLRGETSESVAVALRALGHPFLVLTAYQSSHLSGALMDVPLLNKPVDDKKLRQALLAMFDLVSGK